MTILPDPNYDPGRPNYPGKGQSPTNPMPPVFFQSLGVVEDFSVYQNIFSGGTINAKRGFTLGLNTYFGLDDFRMSQSGTFLRDVEIKKDLTILNITSTRRLFVNGHEYAPRRIVAKNGTFIALVRI